MPIRFPRPVYWISTAGLIAGSAVLLKDWVGRPHYHGKERLVGRTVIVTGSNTGIGLEVARDFAQRGAKVILACRNLDEAEKAKKDIVLSTFNKNVHVLPLDLASFASIRQFVSEYKASNQNGLDILVNNAGVMRTPKGFTKDGLEMQMGTNHFGPFLLTNLLLDELARAPTGKSRVVTVSSVAHKRSSGIDFDDLNSGKNYDPSHAYAMSKLANVMFTRELARRLEAAGISTITTSACHPGIVWTNIMRHMGIGQSKISDITLGPFLWLLLKSPKQGAQTVIHCALSHEVGKVSGHYYAEAEPSDEAKDAEAAKRLWVISEHWTRLDIGKPSGPVAAAVHAAN